MLDCERSFTVQLLTQGDRSCAEAAVTKFSAARTSSGRVTSPTKPASLAPKDPALAVMDLESKT